MRCFQGRLFTVDGMVEDEAPLKKEIYEQIRYYASTSVARRIEHIVQAIKLACASEPPEIQTDRIHVRNGTYFVDGHFTPEKEYCMNRLPIAYVPDVPAPTRWLQFLNELLYGIYYETRQLLWRPLYLPRRAGQKLQQMGKFFHERGGNKPQKTNRT